MKTAFTLLETVIVVLIVGILAALAVPAVLAAKERAHRETCASNLRQIQLAVEAYVRPQSELRSSMEGFPACASQRCPMDNAVSRCATWSTTPSGPKTSVRQIVPEIFAIEAETSGKAEKDLQRMLLDGIRRDRPQLEQLGVTGLLTATYPPQLRTWDELEASLERDLQLREKAGSGGN